MLYQINLLKSLDEYDSILNNPVVYHVLSDSLNPLNVYCLVYYSVIRNKTSECRIRARISGTEKGQWYVGQTIDILTQKNKPKMYPIPSFDYSVDQDQLSLFSHAIKQS